jgi:Mlc titration factor MtfA (ptsG expression regulator)
VFSFFKNRRRQRMLSEGLADEFVEIIRKNVAVYALLSSAEQNRLLEATTIIARERSYYGVGDFEITDEVIVTIAAQASLLVLHGDGYYFDRVGAILVHGKGAKVRMVHPLGGAELVEEGVPISGQHLEQGEVRLVWNEVLAGGRDARDGFNVVLHEFAHHLDWLDGEYDGVPPLGDANERSHWLDVLDADTSRIRAELRAGRNSLLPDHAADSTIELFAYATEAFFELPHELGEDHPELFDCLLSFYVTDPRTWFPN